MRNRVVVGVLLWLTAVCSVAGLAWFAIDSAGKSVTALPISQSGVAQTLEPTATPTATVDQTSTPPVVPPSSSEPTGVSTGAGSLSSEPTTSTSATQSSSPSRSQKPTGSTTRPPAPKPSPPRTRSDSRSGYWGSVSASCTGATLDRSSGVPANDWKVQVTSERKDESAEYRFTGEHGATVKVAVACSGGRPMIAVDTSGGGD